MDKDFSKNDTLPLSEEEYVEMYDSENEKDPDLPKPKKFSSKLSPHLRGLMGEANLRFARGEHEIAKKMCFEVIRQAPDAFEPYLTLAQMYENNNMKKYKNFLTLAAHLHSSNTEIWCRLADLELQDNDIAAAINCYTRAIKAEPYNIELHMRRINLIKEKYPSRIKSIPTLKLNMAKSMPKSKHEQILKICGDVAKQYYETKHYARAIEALKICIKKIPDHISQDLLNMLLELLLSCERYSDCLDIFTQFFGFQFDLTIQEDNVTISLNSYCIPENLHVDIKTKFIVCVIGLHSYNLVENNIMKEMLEKDNLEGHGMLFFEIAEALMSAFYYKEALDLLIPLVKSKNYSLAGIWLKHAECLSHLNLYDQAIEAYQNVIAMAPNHVDVLYPLAMLLLKQDRKEEALEVLSQDLSSGKLHVAVLIEQMKLLKQIEDLENYWKCCELLLSRHCIVFKNYLELRVVLRVKKTIKEKQQKIAKIRMVKGEESDFEWYLENVSEPSVEDEYKIYLEILQFAFAKKAYKEFQKFAFMGLGSKRFQPYFPEIFIIAGYSCIFNKDYSNGYLIARELLYQKPDCNNTWNLYSIIVHRIQETIKMNRFFEASTIKCRMPPINTELVKANHFCVTAHYPQCLSYFLKEYKNSRNSYAAFMIGIAMLQQYCQRKKNTIEKKSMVETVTYLFFNYAKIRSKYVQQEVFYNLGRMYQQIGIFYLAEHCYKKVFDVKNEFLLQYSEYLDLRMEAAYNLHIIYKNSGNLNAARRILWRYVVIE